jgi:adenylate cyclase
LSGRATKQPLTGRSIVHRPSTSSIPLRSRRDLRLASGLVLFVYLTVHLACHALGLASLDIAERALRATVLFWHSFAGTLLLLCAVAVHVALALLAVYERRTLRMAPAQALRIVLGLTMPIVLLGHYVATRYAFDRFGLASDYGRVVGNLWEQRAQARQLALLAPGWLHGCLGLYFAFGQRRAWQRLRFPLFAAALLLPVLAALGFLTMGRELARENGMPRAREAATVEQARILAETRQDALSAWFVLIALIAAARMLRSANEQRRGAVVRIAYPERTAVVPRGWTVLEASRSFVIPHESLCGGRARCTTCRVRVVDGLGHCPPPSVDEQRALDRIHAEPAIRLACQLRPTGDISVLPLLAVSNPLWRLEPPMRPTVDRDVAVLLCSFRLRNAALDTTDAAHDAIYAIDRFHRAVGAAVAARGGILCGQRCDTWTALFGIDGRAPKLACSQAFDAAGTIEGDVLELIARLSRELGLNADFSLALHVGRIVVGTLGDGGQRTLSAIGPAVRCGESLDSEAKRHGWRFILSQSAADAVGIDAAALEWRRLSDEHHDSGLQFAAFASARGVCAVAASSMDTQPRR